VDVIWSTRARTRRDYFSHVALRENSHAFKNTLLFLSFSLERNKTIEERVQLIKNHQRRRPLCYDWCLLAIGFAAKPFSSSVSVNLFPFLHVYVYTHTHARTHTHCNSTRDSLKMYLDTGYTVFIIIAASYVNLFNQSFFVHCFPTFIALFCKTKGTF
jgi:hypothetical protein